MFGTKDVEIIKR